MRKSCIITSLFFVMLSACIIGEDTPDGDEPIMGAKTELFYKAYLSIQGPSTLPQDTQATWTISHDCPYTPHTRWYIKSDDPQNPRQWIGPVGTGTSYSDRIRSYDGGYLDLKATATCGWSSLTRTKRVICTNCANEPDPDPVPGHCDRYPDSSICDPPMRRGVAAVAASEDS